jgi:hypothetical protein
LGVTNGTQKAKAGTVVILLIYTIKKAQLHYEVALFLFIVDKKLSA